MFLFVFRLLLVVALLGAVSAARISCGCTPRPPSYCCQGRYGRCCMARKKRDIAPIDIKPLRDIEPMVYKAPKE
ncbi:hypothetical protein ANCCAN_06452 [Ancylostoma caninum]|uniref:Uncharacterized protein n=1 Tax=Ancylostoma caninum TaxID=29170 RepID=A0A368GW31_ANCCA|nr:hypothetical protein ANCCAN_06452 [Ancylostoma caninum]